MNSFVETSIHIFSTNPSTIRNMAVSFGKVSFLTTTWSENKAQGEGSGGAATVTLGKGTQADVYANGVRSFTRSVSPFHGLRAGQ